MPVSNPVDFATAVRLLRAGEICAFPTETVYGLGADATSADAVLKIYQSKNRPRFNPLIVHCSSLEMAMQVAEFSATATHLARLWPGPLTLVLPVRSRAGLCDLVTAGLDSVGVRIPAHDLARQLISAVGKPLAAPSANPSGKLSPTIARQVRTAFKDCVPVLDGGPCETGLESTILAVNGDRVSQLRAGGLSRETIEHHIGHNVKQAGKLAGILAPGMMASHYAPRARLRLNARFPAPGEAYLAFGPEAPAAKGARNLSPGADLTEAARNLFAFLHELDVESPQTIAVAPIPDHGLGEAINDRLQRAAAPRN